MKNKKLRKTNIVMMLVLTLILLTAYISPVYANTYTVVKNGATIYTTSDSIRALSCDRMYTMSSVEWKIDETLRYGQKIKDGNLTDLRSLNKYFHGVINDDLPDRGQITRKGIPYSQVYREFSSTAEVPYTVRKGEKTIVSGGKTYYSVKGVDCSSAVSYAWRSGARNGNMPSYSDNLMKRTNISNSTKSIYDTSAMFYDAMNNTAVNFVKSGVTYQTGTFLTKVGNYGAYEPSASSAEKTTDVIEALTSGSNYNSGKDIYTEVYAPIKPGDAIMRKTASVNHVRLVTGVTIVTRENGSIDENLSKIQFIGQLGFKEGDYNALTSWENTSETFAELVRTNYIPIRLNGIDE